MAGVGYFRPSHADTQRLSSNLHVTSGIRGTQRYPWAMPLCCVTVNIGDILISSQGAQLGLVLGDSVGHAETRQGRVRLGVVTHGSGDRQVERKVSVAGCGMSLGQSRSPFHTVEKG
jgi:hypothetical protein